MEDSIQTLLSRLMTGPTFLLLGQTLGESGDVRSDLEPAVPTVVQLHGDLTATYQILDSRLRSEPVPAWLSEIALYPWNGVFTSRIDSLVADVFRCDWRRVIPTSQAQLGRHVRSATALQVRYLFGGLGLPEDERPPTDNSQEAETRARVAETLNTLADTLITPRGVVVIEGYNLGDWLTPQELSTFVARLEVGQAHLFSASDALLEDPFVRTAIDRGVLCAHTDSFSTVLDELEAAGRFQRFAAGRGVGGQRFIPVGDSFAEVDVNTWNRVIDAARPIDIEVLEPFASASSAMKYQRFRAFLGSSEGAPPWKAVASGYNLRREFEDALLQRVQGALSGLSFPEPIVVAGPTATGKTIALCALALDVARSGQAAVLHRSRRGDRPTIAEIDAFSSWADESYGIPTLLVWDGMVDVDEYYTLQRQLRSTGRRVLIVGSSYLPPRQGGNVLRAESSLSVIEINRVKTWLSAFGVPMPDDLGAGLDSSFLALLYRLLPETRVGLRRGLMLEMRAAEIGLEKLSKVATWSDESRRLGAVAQALADAGFNVDQMVPSERPHAELVDLLFEERSSTERLTSMILVAGRRGLLVPLELVLRVLGREGSSRILDLVKNFDIFRWTEDESGSQYLGTRTQLAAELLAREDLNVRAEVEVAARMIENLRPSPSRWGGEEVQFIVDLIEGMGPRSPERSRYASYYLSLTDAFRNLREAGDGRSHHRLVLLEASLTRDYVSWTREHGVSSYPERTRLLRGMQRLLETTLEEADPSPRSQMPLLFELSSTNAAQVFELAQLGDKSDAAGMSALMGEVTRLALSAHALDPEDVYPVDVVAWSTQRALESGVLPKETGIDLLASAQALLDSIDPDTLSPFQRARYEQRQVEMSRMINNLVLEAEHLAALSANADPAAYYFIAWAASRGGSEGMDFAVQSLLRAPAEARSDWRCSRLLLDLFWEMKTGKRFLRGEREVLAFSNADWNECMHVADAIPSVHDFDRYRIDFLRGLSLFHLGFYQNSEEEFRRLDLESQNLFSRVVVKYLASSPEGKVRTFTGRVIQATPDGRQGTAWVDQLGIEVPFIPLRFSVSDFRSEGDVLPPFHIAFNMRGALAEPIRTRHRSKTQAPNAR